MGAWCENDYCIIWKKAMACILELIMDIFTFETWSPCTETAWERTVMPCTHNTPAVFCGLKNLIGPSIGMRVGR